MGEVMGEVMAKVKVEVKVEVKMEGRWCKDGITYSLSARTSPGSAVDASRTVDTSGAVNTVGEAWLVMALL